MEKQISKVKTYKIQLTEYADGSSRFDREADGFTAIELLGLLDLTAREIIEMMKDKLQVDEIVRKVVTD